MAEASSVTDASGTDDASSLAGASGLPLDPSGWSDASPPPVDASSADVPASIGAIAREPTVLLSATNPWLKCVTSPVATEPATVVGTRSNADPSLVDHTTTGVEDPPL
jgi:hypothetical protein